MRILSHVRGLALSAGHEITRRLFWAKSILWVAHIYLIIKFWNGKWSMILSRAILLNIKIFLSNRNIINTQPKLPKLWFRLYKNNRYLPTEPQINLEPFLNSHAIGMAVVRLYGLEIDFLRNPISESAAWFFVTILKLFLHSFLTQNLWKKNFLTPKNFIFKGRFSAIDIQ